MGDRGKDVMFIGTEARWACRHPISAAVLAAVALSGVFQATASAAEKVGPIEVNVQPQVNTDRHGSQTCGVRHGYVEYRVQLRNTSAEDRSVELSYPGTEMRRYGDGLRVTRTVLVPGEREILVSLFTPTLETIGGGVLGVQVEGEREGRDVPISRLFESHYRWQNEVTTAVLVSRSVPQEFRDRVYLKPKKKPGEASAKPSDPPAAAVMGAPGMPGMPGVVGPAGPEAERDPFAFLRNELPVSQWSPNWLGYSCYDAILMTEQEAAEMPAAVQLTIRRWIECGGTLLVHGRKAPDAFTQGGVRDAKGGYVVGFGRVAAMLDGGQSNWETTYKKLKESPPYIYQPDQRPSQLHDLLVAEATVPVRGLFVVVCVFAIGIGPANLWLLSRYKRRIWLWWNVPVLSLVTCLTVFGYSLASEGWRGHGKTASLTLLDERCHRATTIGYVSYYCPLTPSSGPMFSVDTDVTLLDGQGTMGYRANSIPRYVDWTREQHLTSGWVNARVPAYLQFRKNEARRERLSIAKQADGSLKVVNALGADIERLCVADAEGRIFEGSGIPAGAERTLAGTGKKTKEGAGLVELQKVFRSNGWLEAFSAWTEKQELAKTLAPGGYIVILDHSPFVETPLPNVESEDTATIVYGIAKEL